MSVCVRGCARAHACSTFEFRGGRFTELGVDVFGRTRIGFEDPCDEKDDENYFVFCCYKGSCKIWCTAAAAAAAADPLIWIMESPYSKQKILKQVGPIGRLYKDKRKTHRETERQTDEGNRWVCRRGRELCVVAGHKCQLEAAMGSTHHLWGWLLLWLHGEWHLWGLSLTKPSNWNCFNFQGPQNLGFPIPIFTCRDDLIAPAHMVSLSFYKGWCYMLSVFCLGICTHVEDDRGGKFSSRQAVDCTCAMCTINWYLCLELDRCAGIRV